MKHIKLFESYIVNEFGDEDFFKNLNDILVELRDDGLFTKVYTYDYTTEWLNKYSKRLTYYYKGSKSSLSEFVKEECTLLTIYIGKDDTEFIFKQSYNSCFEMVDDYIKEFYKLEYDDIFYIESNSTIHKGDWLSKIGGKKMIDLRIDYILPIGTIKSDNKRSH